VPHKNISISGKTLTNHVKCGKKLIPGWLFPGVLYLTHPSPTLVKTAVGKGLSERVFLLVAETKADGIGSHIKSSFIHGVGAVRTI
jgi:hypothetical protein